MNVLVHVFTSSTSVTTAITSSLSTHPDTDRNTITQKHYILARKEGALLSMRLFYLSEKDQGALNSTFS